MRQPVKLLQVALLVLAATGVGAAETNDGVRHRPGTDAEPTVQRLIVKFRTPLSIQAVAPNQSATAAAAAEVAAANQRVTALASRTSLSMRETHGIGSNMHVMQVTPIEKGVAVDDTLARLMADPEVEYAVPDRRMYLHSTTPSDPIFLTGPQWYLQDTQPSSINAASVWDTVKGDTNTVIAVVDTGARFDHPDLKRVSDAGGGHFLAGYDFVSGESTTSFNAANDGDGRDADATDPGDFCNSGDRSSWHGTRVAGIIGALTNNTRGVAGINWNVSILPVRVIGKCGGFNSDVLAGLNWAAGVHVPNVPDNPTPAKIINVSLGGQGSCDSGSANVISTLASMGVLVVVSAGNEGGPVDSPANCPGAMGIAGIRHIGTKVGYSSLGPEVKLAAPAGNCPGAPQGLCEFSIDTTTNPGSQTPIANGEGYTTHMIGGENIGTSFSSPIVSGIAGLMLNANSNLKASQLVARLQEGARPFPTSSTTPNVVACHNPTGPNDPQGPGGECICTTAVCGAGMAYAPGALAAALRPIALVANPGVVTPGTTVNLDGAGSSAANGHTITSYAWVRGGASISTGPTASVTAPTSGNVTVCLTVIDDSGKQDTSVVTVSPSAATITAAAVGTNPCLSEVSVVATDASASEAGPDTGLFTLTRSGSTTAALTVTIAMTGTATNGTDYQNIAGTVTFAAGSATATVTLTPIDDSVVAGSRTATLSIQNGSGYTAGTPASATVTIADNDTPAPAPQQSGGGGGGGALDPLVLMGLALAVIAMLGRSGRLPRHPKQLRQHITTKQRRTRR